MDRITFSTKLKTAIVIRCNNLPAPGYKIDALLRDKNRMSAMQDNVRRFARPHASGDIASIIIKDPETDNGKTSR